MSRSAALRVLGLLSAVLTALVASASTALAQVPVPDPVRADSAAPPPPTIVTHTVVASGVTTWAVLLVAAVAIAVGAGIGEVVRAARRRTGRGLVAASS